MASLRHINIGRLETRVDLTQQILHDFLSQRSIFARNTQSNNEIIFLIHVSFILNEVGILSEQQLLKSCFAHSSVQLSPLNVTYIYSWMSTHISVYLSFMNIEI